VTHKLLLADDSVTIQRVVELTFSGEDVQVVTVGDGEQAIARIPVEHPDIVLADIGMPKRSGYDVAAFVKGRPDLSHIPVLLLAGAFEPVDEARAEQVKSDGVLVKPFEPQQVISRVRELIDGGRTRAAHAIAAPKASSVVAEPPRPPEHRRAPFESRLAEPRSVIAERRPAMPEPHAADSGVPSVEDYFDFDRLDAAFARLGTDPDTPELPRSSRHRDDYGDRFDVPTVDSLLASAPLRDIGGASVTRPSMPDSIPRTDVSPPGAGTGSIDSPATPGGRNVIADVFNALFAAEQGEPDAAPIRLTPQSTAAPAVTDELVDEVTRRVLQRLAPNSADALVTRIVSEVAERLIREEIARIKAKTAKE
jgi:CheY-like chemotaxis protein